MDLEASLIQRLQELRKWQIEQEEKLLQQQHEQRELLTIEQERMYEALGLKEIISDDSLLEQLSTISSKVVNSPMKQLKDSRKIIHSPVKKLNDSKTSELSRCSSPANGNTSVTSITSEKEPTGSDDRHLPLNVPALRLTSSASGLSNFSSPRRCQSIPASSDYDSESNYHDEIVETPRGFRISSNVSVEGVEPLPIDHKPIKQCLAIDDVPLPSPKKDFNTLLEESLRESASAEPSPHNDHKKVIKRPFLKRGEGLARFKPNRNMTKASSRPRSASLSAMGYTQNVKNSGKNKETPKSRRNQVSRRSAPMTLPVCQQKLNLKSVAPPKKTMRSKSLSAGPPSPLKTPSVPDSKKIKSGDEANPSDLDSSKLDTKMFEFLEEKAENSSFCSTSSAVIAFMQQSTPLKLRSIKQKLCTQTLSPSRLDKQGSPIRAIRETVVQKDIVISQWDSGPFIDDNTPVLLANNQRDVRAIKTPNIQGSRETNTKVLYYNNNNNMERSEDTENDSNVSSATLDSIVETNPVSYREDNKDSNGGMHVRFAEYNEYKTIGLTDTSMLSTESHADNYGDKAWSEQSASSESSDVESSAKADTNILQNLPRPNQLNFNRCNMKYQVEPQLPVSMHPRNHQKYEDSTDHSTDDEQSVLNDSEGTSYDEDNTISELQEAVLRTMENYNNKVNRVTLDDVTPTKDQPNEKDTEEGTIFKSELLKTRLLELEREIEIFRSENTALGAQREKLREEHRLRMKELKEKEDSLEKERIKMETSLQEEKKRIIREKSALENRLRDAREKSIQTKQERQEVQLLKEQLDELKDEMNEKEQRWQAAQARQKSQMRVLQMENTKLKQELEKLQNAKRGPAKLKRPGTMSNTRAIHQINRNLDKKIASRKQLEQSPDDEEVSIKSRDKIPSVNNDLLSSNDTGKVIVYESLQRVSPTEEEIAKRRNLYQDLLKEAAGGFKEEVFKKNVGISESNTSQKENAETRKVGIEEISPSQIGKELTGQMRKIDSPSVLKSTENIDRLRGSYQQFVREVLTPKMDSRQSATDSPSSMIGHQRSIITRDQSSQGTNILGDKEVYQSGKARSHGMGKFDREADINCKPGGVTTRIDESKVADLSESELTPRDQHQQPLPKPSESMTPRADAVSISQLSDLSGPKMTPSKQVREVLHPDGYTEYWYPNGNVKKVYPDRNITKLIYYNGDVRETTEDGCIKYFYAATKTWHTTYPDGFEILEFPDGQEERRTTDGVIEVSFPDGSIRLMQPDGIEKWALPDGTSAETFPNGEKILTLPNGQREIHTNEHKRREYPDGTVKYVYPNGTQETHYPNGRIRVKDKDGNLLRDSHQS